MNFLKERRHRMSGRTSFEDADIGTYEKLRMHARSSPDETPVQLRHSSGNNGLGLLIRGFGGDLNGTVTGDYDENGLLMSFRVDFNNSEEGVHETRTLGVVGVDSGQLLLTDPCYVLPSV
jgi:hypothetical protein